VKLSTLFSANAMQNRLFYFLSLHRLNVTAKLISFG